VVNLEAAFLRLSHFSLLRSCVFIRV